MIAAPASPPSNARPSDTCPATQTRRKRPGRASQVLLLTIALLATLPAHAARWTNIGKENGASIEVDAASLDRNGDKVRLWHRETYAPRRLHEAGAFSYASVKQLTEFQCDKRQAAVQRRIYFADSGSELKAESFESKDSVAVVPDSPVEAVLNFACRKPKAPEPAPEPAKPAPLPEPVKGAKGKGAKEAPPPPPKSPTPWNYDGKTGPAQWGKLDADYATCGSGQQQSPIDIRAAIRADLPPLRVDYKPAPLDLLDDGKGVRLGASGGGTLTVDGEEFELGAIRFHRPGEEMVNGKRAAMSLRLEHKAKSGRIAMLAVPVQEGKENKVIRALWSALPLERGKPVQSAAKVDFLQLLPPKRDYYLYSGSLTTPPCTEGVLWIVLRQPLQLSREQIADFGKIYRNNVRPVQPANGRVVKESR